MSIHILMDKENMISNTVEILQYGEPWGNSGYENIGYWPQIAEEHIKGIISVSPDSHIFPYIEKC